MVTYRAWLLAYGSQPPSPQRRVEVADRYHPRNATVGKDHRSYLAAKRGATGPERRPCRRHGAVAGPDWQNYPVEPQAGPRPRGMRASCTVSTIPMGSPSEPATGNASCRDRAASSANSVTVCQPREFRVRRHHISDAAVTTTAGPPPAGPARITPDGRCRLASAAARVQVVSRPPDDPIPRRCRESEGIHGSRRRGLRECLGRAIRP
jgi:hypothetical protein